MAHFVDRYSCDDDDDDGVNLLRILLFAYDINFKTIIMYILINIRYGSHETYP